MENTSSSSSDLLIDLELGNLAAPAAARADPNKKQKGGRLKKPPKPPRPPRPVPLALSDQKLVNDLTEIAMLKKARIQRIKALKHLKSAKPPSPAPSASSANCCALLVTLLFCLLLFWHGLFSRGAAAILPFHGSPQSSFVSLQTYRNAPPTISPRLSAASSSPKYQFFLSLFFLPLQLLLCLAPSCFVASCHVPKAFGFLFCTNAEPESGLRMNGEKSRLVG